MSQENVELVRATFDETRRRGDPIPPAEFFDPKVEFHEDPRLPEAGTYRGVEEVLGYWGQFIESFDEFVIEPEDFVDIGGDRVLILLVITTRGRGSSVAVTMRIAWIFTLRDSLIIRIEAFADREEALEAAGLRARGHIPVDPQAPLVEFERIASQYPVFRIRIDSPRSSARAFAEHP